MAPVGGIEEVEGFANNLEFESLARFAVDEHNKKENALLEFHKVTKVKRQIVSGIIYYITLEAANGSEKKVYEAKILVQAWENLKELQEFKLVGDA